MSLDLVKAREIFEVSTDFTVGIEEEFQILDPESLELTQRFEELQAAAAEDPELGISVAGELISSEIEIRSGRGENFPHAVALQDSFRGKLFAVAERQGVKLGAVAQPLRAALTGSLASPGIFEVMQVLGRDESLGRIRDAADERSP